MKIEDYFISDDFINSIKESNIFTDDVNKNIAYIESLINTGILYSILFDEKDNINTDNLDNIIKKTGQFFKQKNISPSILNGNSTVKDYMIDLFINTKINEMGLVTNNLESKEVKNDIYSFFMKNDSKNSYIYHAFNSVNLDSIKEKGIIPNPTDSYQNDIDLINNIYLKNNICSPFGWQKINCQDKVSYSNTASVSYGYGLVSPEWFSHFVGDDLVYSGVKDYKKRAFIQNDYNEAKKNILSLLNNKNVSEEETIQVINFFDNQWEKYANKQPMLAMIPKSNEKSTEDDTNKKIARNLVNKKDDYNLAQEINYDADCLFGLNGIDDQTDEKIDTTNAIFIKLPSYNYIEKKVLENSIDNEKIMTTKKSI